MLASESQLAQIFQHLISNAIQYRGESPLHVQVLAEKNNETWTFSVGDNGPGIAQEYHDTIFEPFKRLHGPELPGSGSRVGVLQ